MAWQLVFWNSFFKCSREKKTAWDKVFVEANWRVGVRGSVSSTGDKILKRSLHGQLFVC